jgi:hypothetical protein
MALPSIIAGERWASVAARFAFPILVAAAKEARKLTFQELDDLVGFAGGPALGRGLRVWGHAIGRLNSAIEDTLEQEDAPVISALVINGTSKLPPPGIDFWLRRIHKTKTKKFLRGKISPDLRAHLVLEAQRQTFEYDGWDSILSAWGLSKIKPAFRRIDTVRSEPDKSKMPEASAGGLGGGESDAHLELKQLIFANPHLVGASSVIRKKKEYRLASKDSVDVAFETATCWVLVEVKPAGAPQAELERGIFQCVKYARVMEAWIEWKDVEPVEVQTVLVCAGELTESLSALCDALDIRVVEGRDLPQT